MEMPLNQEGFIISAREPEINSIAQSQSNDSAYLAHMQEVLSIPSDNFFNVAVEKLASILGVRYVCITECCDEPATRVRTRAFWNHDQIIENINYPLIHSPCEKVIKGNTCYYPEGVQKFYPKDQDLVELNVSGYLATPIFNQESIIIGHIVAMDPEPIDIDEASIEVLKGFAIRASGEAEQDRVKSMIEALTSGYHLPLGGDFFQQLTKIIADILDVDFAVMG